jgi:hypothetical protein
VESTDYRLLVANLRASGIPEPLLRDFIALDLLQHYGRKAATIRSTSPATTATTPYWRKPSNPDLDPHLRQQLQELNQERLAVLRGLFGPEVRPQDGWNLLNGGADHDAIRFAWLPPEQLAAALAVLQPDLDLETQVNSTPGMREVDPDEEQARLERRIAALKPLLTPAQLEEFRLREDPHTEEVRSLTHYCNLSADDFRRIAPLRKELFHRPAVTWEDQQSLEAEVSRLLGTAKAREFVRGMDHTYIYALRVTEHIGLPADVAHRIWEIKREAMASAATLASLPDIPDADRARQHRDIAERTTREFKGLVGDDGFRVLRTDWPFWQNLERPGSVSSNRRKR